MSSGVLNGTTKEGIPAVEIGPNTVALNELRNIAQGVMGQCSCEYDNEPSYEMHRRLKVASAYHLTAKNRRNS
jgi:hypothetical protein